MNFIYFVHAYEYLCTQTVWKHIHSIVLLIAMENKKKCKIQYFYIYQKIKYKNIKKEKGSQVARTKSAVILRKTRKEVEINEKEVENRKRSSILWTVIIVKQYNTKNKYKTMLSTEMFIQPQT